MEAVVCEASVSDENNENLEILKFLIAKGADINYADNRGKTALVKASREGFTDVVKLLITRGAKANLFDDDGYTALMLAIF